MARAQETERQRQEEEEEERLRARQQRALEKLRRQQVRAEPFRFLFSYIPLQCSFSSLKKETSFLCLSLRVRECGESGTLP